MTSEPRANLEEVEKIEDSIHIYVCVLYVCICMQQCRHASDYIFNIYLMCMSVFSACLPLDHGYGWCLKRPEECVVSRNSEVS